MTFLNLCFRPGGDANALLLDTLITRISCRHGVRYIGGTGLKGIIGFCTPVNLFICQAHPMRKPRYCTLTHNSSVNPTAWHTEFTSTSTSGNSLYDIVWQYRGELSVLFCFCIWIVQIIFQQHCYLLNQLVKNVLQFVSQWKGVEESENKKKKLILECVMVFWSFHVSKSRSILIIQV